MSLPTRTKYLIVGAGPAGLAAALSLVKHGVSPHDLVVVDKQLEGENTSRAMVVHAATLEALDSLGCAEAIVQCGYKAEYFRIQDRTSATILNVGFSSLSSYTKYPFFLNAPQTVTERVLGEHVKALGIQILRPFTVVGMKDSETGKGLTVSFESGDVMTADIVVGADGSKSVIRQLSGIDFRDLEGRLYSESVGEPIQSVIADVVFSELPAGFKINASWVTLSPAGVNLIVPFTADTASSLYQTDKVIHRIIFTLPSSHEPPPSHPPLEVLQGYLDDYAPFLFSSDTSKNAQPIRLSKVYWSSRFRHRAAVADTFYKKLGGGPVFLVGDAAHVHSPAGGQGMNLGIRDAISLGRVLAEQDGKPDSELHTALVGHGKSRRDSAIKVVRLTHTIINGASAIMENKIYYWVVVMLGYIPAFRNMVAWRLSGLGNRPKLQLSQLNAICPAVLSDEKRSDLQIEVGSINPDETAAEVDPRLEKRVWRKLDLFVLPVAALFYFWAFLDRTNIANARVAGLQRDLKMTNHQYSVALTVTYVPYIAAELPSNWVLKVWKLYLVIFLADSVNEQAVGPNYMLPTMLSLWGVVTICQGVVKTYGSLLACRFFIGFFEGGLFPGLTLYMSYFYPRYKMNLRVSAYFASASLSGAFSGILAYGIVRMDGVSGRSGWSWIFILEGFVTVAFGLVSYFLLPRNVEKAWFFNAEEKRYVSARLREDNTQKDEDHFTWREVREAFKLPQVWLSAFTLFMSGTILYSLAYFAPTIVESLGHTAARAQLMTVPPFAAGFVVSIACAFISDKYQCRGLTTIFSAVLSTIGFSIFLGSRHHPTQYGSLFFSISGAYTAAPTLSAWAANNATPQTRRATAIAVAIIMANAGGILATWLMGSLSHAPRYTSATITLVVFSVCMGFGAAGNLWYLSSQNRKKAEKRHIMSKAEEEPGLGDRSAWFVYNL
ncbi:hypothetical protein VNI00_012272 [Paramarasmius palmivorus]|uniref:Major facilitator superfamily (MFS) profile domain-containing protein n=1 Tax=Paramarasmius palmivorus TaxID=297713 RepID=A0AAW0C754_9AGAR